MDRVGGARYTMLSRRRAELLLCAMLPLEMRELFSYAAPRDCAPAGSLPEPLCLQNDIHILCSSDNGAGAVSDCNQQFVFLHPHNPREAFAKRSLDKRMNDYGPDNAVKDVSHNGTAKGHSDAFNTLCRKFLKSSLIPQMRAQSCSRSDTKKFACCVCITLIKRATQWQSAMIFQVGF